jgi:hypothetical protein
MRPTDPSFLLLGLNVKKDSNAFDVLPSHDHGGRHLSLKETPGAYFLELRCFGPDVTHIDAVISFAEDGMSLNIKGILYKLDNMIQAMIACVYFDHEVCKESVVTAIFKSKILLFIQKKGTSDADFCQVQSA